MATTKKSKQAKPKPPPPGLLSTAEVAELCGVAVETVKRWRAAGKITGRRLGHRTVRYARQEIERFLARGC